MPPASEATGVQVADTLPTYVTGNDLNRTVTIGPNGTHTFTFTAFLAANAPFGRTIVNTAYFTHTSGSGQSSASFNIS